MRHGPHRLRIAASIIGPAGSGIWGAPAMGCDPASPAFWGVWLPPAWSWNS